ncbi:hypothetical protein GCM10008905_31760 [Clostridium malenominatum]|uniref:Histidine kinase n=1 Tax=Clostridium malenominatum TaxID=1539 RepID=A0ABP3UHH3_9CLOT
MSSILYIIAALLVFIPTSIVLVTEFTFSSFFSKIFLSAALTLIIVGKILTIIKKSKNDKSIPKDVGIIIGLLIVLVSKLLR